jgi:hypothetical protein
LTNQQDHSAGLKAPKARHLVAAAVRPWIKFRMKFEARRAGIQAGNSSTDAAPSALNQNSVSAIHGLLAVAIQ